MGQKQAASTEVLLLFSNVFHLSSPSFYISLNYDFSIPSRLFATKKYELYVALKIGLHR